MADASSPTNGDGSPTTLPIVVITGGTGNLGTKLSHHLLRHNPPKYRVRLIEHPSYFQKQNVHPLAEVTLGDVGDAESGLDEKNGWASALDGADALVHFSAVNPYPNADWSESAQSMDHSLNVFQAACRSGVRRVVLATSNHVMGQYKEQEDLKAGALRPDMPPRVGTPLRDPAASAASGDATAYAAAKLAGERAAACLAAFHAPRTTFVCLRIGWCQPGENSPSTLSAAGSPPEFQTETGAAAEEKLGDDAVDEKWFRGMWLSNRDFLSYFESALTVDVPLDWNLSGEEDGGQSNPHRYRKRGFLLLNAMSKNAGAKWALDQTESHLGIVSQDDSFKPLS